MQLSRKEERAVVYVAIGGLIMVVCLIVYSKTPHYYTNDNGANQNHDGPQWTDIMLALYTYVLAVATVGMWYIMQRQREISETANTLLERANATADASLDISKDARRVAVDSLNETKRSVDAYIDAERGRLVFHDILENQGDWVLHWTFKNVGAGHVDLVDCRPQHQVVRKEREINTLPNRLVGVTGTKKVIEGGGFLTTKHGRYPEHSTCVLTDKFIITIEPQFHEALNAGRSDVQIVFFCRYWSLGSLYDSVTSVRLIDRKNYQILWDNHLTFETKLL